MAILKNKKIFKNLVVFLNFAALYIVDASRKEESAHMRAERRFMMRKHISKTMVVFCSNMVITEGGAGETLTDNAAILV